MRLKSIEMQGFKSFADKIYLDFNPGITAIVGPNGSGKSNISDAIRWVMGEQSVKSLRGSKMEDVIFSGTEQRKALGFAEVTLVLDNTDNYFSLDFPEITVTRRVYRSGEGEYYINKTLCRLKDIHELFMDTGLGRDGYSIIGQGKIDNILSTKSEDRRQIFEEAAGISKYKYRKIEAERKLNQATDNLVRVEDILRELEGRLGPLERQSEKARKYLVLRDEMRGLDITVSVINAEKAKKELAELNKNIAILAEQIDEIRRGMEATDAEISAMYEKLEEYDREIEEYRGSDRNTVEELNEVTNKINLLMSDMEHNNQNIARLEDEIKLGKDEADRLDNVVAENIALLEELNKKNQGASESLETIMEESRQNNADTTAKNDILESVKSDIIETTAQINAINAECSSLEVLVNNYNARKAAVERELSGRNDDKDKLIKDRDEVKKNLEKCEVEVKTAEKVIADLERETAELEEEAICLLDDKNQKMISLNQKQSRHTMLSDMEREYEGYGKGVKGVMTAYNDGKIKNANIHGPLAQLIKTEKRYIAAIETALGGANQNIVVDSEEDAKNAIKYLKEEHLGRVTFLPISAIRPKKFDDSDTKGQKGVIAIASEVIECNKKYKDIVSSFLGTTVICDNMDNSITLARRTGHSFRIVTLEGDVIQPGGAMTGGSRGKTTGSLSRAGEIETLANDIKKLEADIAKAEVEREKCSKLLEEKKSKVLAENKSIQDKRQECVRLNSEFSYFKQLLENLEISENQLLDEITDVEGKLLEIAREKQVKEDTLKQLQEKWDALENQAATVQREYTELSGKGDVLVSKLTELNIERNSILKDIELQNDRISRLNTEKAQYIEAITAKSGGIQMMRDRNADILKEIDNIKNSETEMEQAIKDYREKIEKMSAERSGVEVRIREKQNSVKDVQEQMFSLTQQQGKMESKSAKFELELENIVNRLLEEYELPYSEAVALKQEDGFDYKEATIRIKELRDSIRELGNINIDAIEEYKEIKERFEFLSAQADDLNKAKKELEDVIEEMLTIMQSRFAEKFKVINENFSKVFGELFGGGRANLTLTEPDNILESGIEIEAQPPGKKLQSLTLLSGGERAFTAIALLFAILNVRPTPFCILDEIEAALDDVNVYRTADYLKKYSDKTQFIVVTHRRGTMEAANILYGVTMQERGISKLLSLNIDEVQAK